MTETIKYPNWPKRGDIARIHGDDIGLVIDVSTAKEVYNDLYEVDDEDGHIWLGGDNVIHHRAVLAQVFSVRGYEWIEIMRLREVSQ